MRIVQHHLGTRMIAADLASRHTTMKPASQHQGCVAAKLSGS